MKIRIIAGITIALLAAQGSCWAQDAGSWNVSTGVYPMQPKSDSGSQFEIGRGTAFALSGSYLMTPHWALELFVTLPVEHEISLGNGEEVGSFKLMPTTVSVQYYFFEPANRIRAFVGLGLTQSGVSNERTTGSLAGKQLELDGAIGPAVQGGIAFQIAGAWYGELSARCFMVEPNTTLDSDTVGRLEIDPCAYGLAVGRRL